ncbi:IscS subfamily cysteine desulfurase [Alkalihalophilus pseudofirmus]|uniref:IscS subfamily cysteine desulfurase n=1 Tax=Alkalihalophilus pseudofirmus TaxID=79885 RepID=A0AAJ2NQA9_ALKPS|nr:IscS subfamily cysteine desulfurase [Alkalihalophilus pseudofirmus]MDV2886611.1 IscS subfamily cysteine desulfurase [Alkalihalophilus pseudofirmus]
MLIYLDHAATTPISKQAIDAWIRASEHYFANTQSLHEEGEEARHLFEICKKEMGELLGCEGSEIYFTGSGSEANQLLLESLFKSIKTRGNHVITSSIEHPSVLSFFQKLEEQRVEVTYLPVSSEGLISIADLKESIRSDTVLASIQHVNSETGSIQPLKEIGAILKEKNIIFHSDCVQSFGKLPLNVRRNQLDAISVASHKIYGPKGVGAAYINKQTAWSPTLPFTHHQNGFRQGTIDLPGIAAFTTAALEIQETLSQQLDHFWKLREQLLSALSNAGISFKVEGSTAKDRQLPSIIGLSIEGIEGQWMMQMLDRHHIQISTGTACQIGSQTPSKTMIALQKTEQDINRYFRISLGRSTTSEQITYTSNKIIEIVHGLQKKEGGVALL